MVAIIKGQWPHITLQDAGGGVSATTAQNDVAIASMIDTGLPMILPPVNSDEHYDYEAKLVLPNGGSLLGVGYFENVRLRKFGKDDGAIRIGGKAEFGNLSVTFSEEVTEADTAANLIEVKGLRESVIKPLRFYNGYNGLYLLQEDGVLDSAGVSTFYQNQIETLYGTDCVRRHIDLSTYGNSASTGNFFGNIRTDNQGRGPIQTSVQFAKFTGSVVQNMNIEAGQYSGAALTLGGHGFNIGSLHMEAIHLTSWGAALIGASGLTLDIGTWKVQHTEIDAGNLGALVKLEPTGGEVEVGSLIEQAATVGAGGDWKAVYYWDSSPTAEPVGLIVRKVNVEDVQNAAEASGSGQTGLIKQWGTA